MRYSSLELYLIESGLLVGAVNTQICKHFRGLMAICSPQPLQDLFQMILHRMLAQPQNLSNFTIRLALGNPMQDFYLAIGKIARLRATFLLMRHRHVHPCGH